MSATATGATIAVNDGSTTSPNSIPMSGAGLANSTALQTIIEGSSQGLLVFGYNSSGVAEITYGAFSNNGSSLGSTSGYITITVSGSHS